MDEVQERPASLEWRGWKIVAMADEAGAHPVTVLRWKSGERTPDSAQALVIALHPLSRRKRTPNKKRYNNRRDVTSGESQG